MRKGIFLLLAVVLAALGTGCGPNVLSVRGTVLHPLHKFKPEEDAELGRPDRILVIRRKEPRSIATHTIVGAYVKPKGLGWLEEPAEIPPQDTDGSGLLIEVAICSDHKDEIVGLAKFDYELILPDGRKIKGTVHRKWPIQNFTQKVTGIHSEPHLVVRDRQAGTATTYTHIEEVENDIELHCGKIRVLFEDDRMITPETEYVIFVMTGFQRQRRYRFDFTFDVDKAMETSNKYEK